MAGEEDPVGVAVAELKAIVTETTKHAATKAELESKFALLKGEVDKVVDAMKKQVERKTSMTLPAASGMATAARELFHDLGLKSVKDMIGVRVYDEGADGRTLPFDIASRDVKQALFTMDLVYIADQLANRVSPEWKGMKAALGEREAFLQSFPQLGRRYDTLVEEMKALTTGGAGSGAEWIPTGFASSLLDEIRLGNPTINMFPSIVMPTNPWTWPMLAGIGVCHIKAETVAAVESNLSTRNRTWNAIAFANHQTFSDEMEEDSIIAVLAEVRRNIARSLDDGLERAIVNGDADGTHIDNDYHGGVATLTEKAFGGLRKFALDPKGAGVASSHSGGGAALTTAIVGAALAKTDRFGHNPADGFILVNQRDYMRLITEAASPVLTRDKFGPMATIETGVLAQLWGRPLLVSNGVDRRRAAVAATGVNTVGGPNTFSTAIIGNRQNWRLGDRRKVTIEDDRNIVTGVKTLVGTARWAFQSIEGNMQAAEFDPSTIPAVLAIINIL